MKYQANPVIVDAFRIESVSNPSIYPIDGIGDTRILILEGVFEYPDGPYRNASKEMCARYVPVPGDYWVRQSDGYEYINPKEVFERKYSPVNVDNVNQA